MITDIDHHGDEQTRSTPAGKSGTPGQTARRREDQLDERLEETFPASDPGPLNPGAD
jgi:hypothetical protein